MAMIDRNGVPVDVSLLPCKECGKMVEVRFACVKDIAEVGYSAVVCKECYEKVPEDRRLEWRMKTDSYVGEVYVPRVNHPQVGDKTTDGWVYGICAGCKTLQPMPPGEPLCHACYLDDLIKDTKALTKSISKRG